MSSEAEGIIDLYQRKALDWVRNREHSGGLMEQSWLDRFRALAPSNGSILDIGCGSAVPIARYLIEAGHRVTGIESSATLIDLCRDRFPAQEWFVADMRTLALGRSFNGILAWDSFFHLCADDQRRMFPLFQQHAAAGAPLMFTSGPAHGEAIGDFEGERASIRLNIARCWINMDFGSLRMSPKTSTADATPSGSRNASKGIARRT
jgi:SAM-dependent methyltransferase